MKKKFLPNHRFIQLFILFISFIFLAKANVSAISPFLEDLEDIISNKRTEALAMHSISFTLPLYAEPINATDYIRVEFTAYVDVLSVPTGLGGVYSGTPAYSIVDKNVLITGINVPPGGKLYIDGITATNPISIFDFAVTLKITEDATGNILKNHATVFPVPHSGDIFMTATVGYPTGEIQISGFTGPLSYLIFNSDMNTVGTNIAGANGVFSKLFTGITPGTHSFSYFGVDSQNRNTSTISIDIPVARAQRSYVLDQLFSPTIQVDDVSIEIGEQIYATGSATPNVDITIFTDSPLRSYATTADASGDWTFSVPNTSSYAPGDYRLYAIAQTQSALQSLFSPAILFTVNSASGVTGGTACGDISEGDLNCDSSINLIDFSILMYYWGTDSEAADINQDGLVGLVDLSIMMYFWGS